MKKIKVGVVIGSLRRGSYSRSIAKAIMDFLPDNFEAEILETGNLVMFNQDFEEDGNTPAEWTAFREKVKAADAYLFVTPEYNRSYPAVIKNALDIGSRPFGQNAWSGKPGAVVSVSPGKPGAFGANHHLRQCMSFLNIFMMQQPEAYIGGVADILDENGKVTNESTGEFLKTIAQSFAAWVNRFVD